MLILIASLSVMGAFGIVSSIPGLKQSKESVKVPTIEKYSASVESPDSDVFNKEAINPTIDVTIGDNQQTSAEE